MLVHGAFAQRTVVRAAQARFLGCIVDMRSLLDEEALNSGVPA